VTPWLLAALVGVAPPIKGRPDDYIGAVGKFTLSSEIRPSRFRLDETATLVLKLDGSGDVSDVRTPDVARSKTFAERFDVVGPAIKKGEATGAVFEYPVRARSIGVKAVPSIRVSIYDESPPQPQYRLLRTAEIPIEVLSVPAKDASSSPQTKTPASGISFGSWTPLAAIVAAAVVAALILRPSSRTGTPNESAPASTPKRRRGKPIELPAVFVRGDSERWIDDLAGALSLPPGQRTSAEILTAATKLGLKKELVETLHRNLEALDASRFGGRAPPASIDHDLRAIVAGIKKVEAISEGGERSAAPRG